ncbi:MAG: ferritin-like domain-containing protein [Pyrinomonadaceae bacterium]
MESTDPPTDASKLISILQLAYSGELAAAFAYRGHWHSVADQAERERIKTIEAEEWRHRLVVGDMLKTLGAAADSRRERRARIIGKVLGLMCHMSGWFAPMYGAGRLESRNIVEYETAARHARDCGYSQFVDCLLSMAEVEWEHEQYFREHVSGHPLRRVISVWPKPPERANIRQSFAMEPSISPK